MIWVTRKPVSPVSDCGVIWGETCKCVALVSYWGMIWGESCTFVVPGM